MGEDSRVHRACRRLVLRRPRPGCRSPKSRERFSRGWATRSGSSRWWSASARSSASCSPSRVERWSCRAVLVRALGEKRLDWAMLLSGFLIGLPVFFQVGLVLLSPVLFTAIRQTGTPLLRLAIPLIAGLSVSHGFVPPHPGPLAAIERLGADTGRTLFYSLVLGLARRAAGRAALRPLHQHARARRGRRAGGSVEQRGPRPGTHRRSPSRC